MEKIGNVEDVPSVEEVILAWTRTSNCTWRWLWINWAGAWAR